LVLKKNENSEQLKQFLSENGMTNQNEKPVAKQPELVELFSGYLSYREILPISHKQFVVINFANSLITVYNDSLSSIERRFSGCSTSACFGWINHGEAIPEAKGNKYGKFSLITRRNTYHFRVEMPGEPSAEEWVTAINSMKEKQTALLSSISFKNPLNSCKPLAGILPCFSNNLLHENDEEESRRALESELENVLDIV